MELTREEQDLLQNAKRQFPFPILGGWYTQAEVDAINASLQESMDCASAFTARRLRSSSKSSRNIAT